jgi:SSS family solute:Na+ symporter
MQFMILFIGILVFVFFLFTAPPIHFNTANLDNLRSSAMASELTVLEDQYAVANTAASEASRALVEALRADESAAIETAQSNLKAAFDQRLSLAEEVDNLIIQQNPEAITEDRDYVFITFITQYLPIGLIGLLLAVIFSAAMSSTSSELSALATTTMVDIYRRSLIKNKEDDHYFKASKWLTIMWGSIALGFAAVANLFDNLIQAVNIIGSLFYGVILGIFVVAFFFKRVGSKAVLIAAVIAEIIVGLTFVGYALGYHNMAYLWLNLIGCSLTVIIALLFPLKPKAEVAG